MFLGIHDENNRAYCPKIVRIGLKAHHSIKAVSLDELVCWFIRLSQMSLKLAMTLLPLLFDLPHHYLKMLLW